MGRSVERLASRATARAISLLGLVASCAAGADGDGDGPELTPPSEMVIISKPASPAQVPARPSTNMPAKPSTPAIRSRATLALPGLTSPVNRPVVIADPSRPATSPTLEGPSLDAPLEMGTLPNALPSGLETTPSRSARPLILESSPIEELPPVDNSTQDQTSTKKPTTSPSPAQAPTRRPRIFGFLGPASSPAPTPAPARSTPPGRAAAVDRQATDPAAESALKRRIERQARDVVGNRARSVEVRLQGKEATILVTGAKLFQKRPLRKQLEAIPALTGLRSTIEIND